MAPEAPVAAMETEEESQYRQWMAPGSAPDQPVQPQTQEGEGDQTPPEGEEVWKEGEAWSEPTAEELGKNVYSRTAPKAEGEGMPGIEAETHAAKSWSSWGGQAVLPGKGTQPPLVPNTQWMADQWRAKGWTSKTT